MRKTPTVNPFDKLADLIAEADGILGKHPNTIPPEQQRRFTEPLRTLRVKLSSWIVAMEEPLDRPKIERAVKIRVLQLDEKQPKRRIQQSGQLA